MYDIDTASGHHFNYSALFMNIKFDSDSSPLSLTKAGHHLRPQ